MANPVAERFGANLRTVRGQMGQRELAERVTALGVPMRFNTVSRIEQGHRVADVPEMLALAVALGCSPSRLLLTADAADSEIELTPTLAVSAYRAWRWAAGDQPLPGPDDQANPRSIEWFGQQAAFVEVNRPHEPRDPTTLDEVEVQYREGSDAVRAAVAAAAREHDVPLRVAFAAVASYAMAERLHHALRDNRDEDVSS